MNLTEFFRLEFLRALRNRAQLLFSVLLPGLMFLIFGGTQDYKDLAVREGNVGAVIMIGMALYGAVVSCVGQSAGAASEFSQGWGRQLQLTALRPVQYVAVKALLCTLMAGVPVLVVYALGAATGARMPLWQWVASGLLCWLLPVLFTLYGLAAGLLFSPQSAPGVAGGSLVVWAFLGNLFAPLSGTLLELARFSPLYGIRGLALYPLTRGDVVNGSAVEQDPLWALLLNAALWTVLLGLLCSFLFRRRAGQRG